MLLTADEDCTWQEQPVRLWMSVNYISSVNICVCVKNRNLIILFSSTLSEKTEPSKDVSHANTSTEPPVIVSAFEIVCVCVCVTKRKAEYMLADIAWRRWREMCWHTALHSAWCQPSSQHNNPLQRAHTHRPVPTKCVWSQWVSVFQPFELWQCVSPTHVNAHANTFE